MNKRIETRNLTREKRKSQTCKVYEVKIDHSHISKSSKKYLYNLFKESKWFYNYCISQNDINNADTTIKSIPVKIDKDKFEQKIIKIPGQIKQGLKTRIFNGFATLKSLKKNGYKIGKLKFKSELNSIPLKQYKKTYDINFKNKKIRLIGLNQKLKVIGLQQIPKEADIACATLVRKAKDFYFHITTYTNKVEKIVPNTAVGIDFGCSTQLTFDNGIKVEFQIPISKRIRILDKQIAKKKTRSNNKFKLKLKRKKACEKLVNQKKDIRNKIVSSITKLYKYVCFQDESIHAWHSGHHGKSIQNSGIGGIISNLKSKSHTPLEVNKFFPSTQLCPKCFKKNKLSLNERTYSCSCGYTNDRDVKSAICIKQECLKKIPTDGREFTLGENLSSAKLFTLLSKISNVKVSKMNSLNQEASFRGNLNCEI